MRTQRGSTQEDVAHRAGVHLSYLSGGVEWGLRNPSLKNIRAIAKAMNVNTADLFFIRVGMRFQKVRILIGTTYEAHRFSGW